MNSAKHIWLDQEATSYNNVVRKRIDTIIGLDCYLGLIGITGARMFQLELDIPTTVHKNFLRKFRGVDIQAIPISATQSVYTIILLERDLTDIFAMFVEDIIEKLHNVSDSTKALTLINQRVNYWRKLFSRASGELLTVERQRGLFGELFFLRLLLQNSSNYHEAICTWGGSESANQDFSRNGKAVEIKTTKANKPIVYISNEQQLDFTLLEFLYLGLISVTEAAGNENSLAGIIEEIRNLVNHDSELVQEFETRLESAGISNDMIEAYNEISYSVTNATFFKIQEGFPVILRSSLNNEAIYNVKYQIDISTCTQYEVQEEEVIKIMI